MAGFDFGAWLQQALAVAAGLLPINLSIVKASEFIGLAGKWQAVFAIFSGLALGIASQIAFYGLPSSFQGWFLAVVFGLVLAGGSIGTYEVVKHAARKANGS